MDRRKRSIESTQVRITKESGKIEGLAKSAIKKTFHKKTVYKEIKQYGKYLTDVGESLEKNKKVSREKPRIAQLEKKIKKAPTAVLRSRLRKKEKRKIEETFNQFDRVEALIRSVYGVYETGEEALRIKTEYDKYHKETGKSPAQFAIDYPEEFLSLSVDATLAVLPQLKVVSKILNVGVEGAAKVMLAAKKLGVRTEEGVLKLGKALTSEKISPFELNPTHKINPRGANYKKILNQLRSDRQMKETIKYIEVNGEKYIVDGHHRIRAAKELKIEKIPVEEVILPYKGYDTVEDLFL